ncbi:MAG: flagellar hook-length control protein FliK [Candidatus Devosia symbiotica]|nr:flagellar hook-length control protein FliK [Candidatus Devosia symbiotica]
MRFAINLPELGEVGAHVSLRGGATGAMLWAAERTTSDALEAGVEGLRDALADAGVAAKAGRGNYQASGTYYRFGHFPHGSVSVGYYTMIVTTNDPTASRRV